jgi:hypothetical protein
MGRRERTVISYRTSDTQVAKEFDITLVGFLREDHFNIYHGSERIAGYASASMGVGE